MTQIMNMRFLWKQTRYLMAQRKTVRTLDRSIRRLEHIDHYALRRGAITTTQHQYLAATIERLHTCRAVMLRLARHPPHPAVEIYRAIRRALPSLDGQ